MFLYKNQIQRWQSISFALVTNALSFLSNGRMPPVTAVAAIIEADEKLLMLDRSDGLGFCLPGGLMHWHESTLEALHREVQEETGLQIEIGRLFHISSGERQDPRLSVVCLTYVARLCGGTLAESSEGRPEWIPLPKLFKRCFAFDHEKIIRAYLLSKKLGLGPDWQSRQLPKAI